MQICFEGGDGVKNPELFSNRILDKFTLWINPHSSNTHSHVRDLLIYLDEPNEDGTNFLHLVRGFNDNINGRTITGFMSDGKTKYPLTIHYYDLYLDGSTDYRSYYPIYSVNAGVWNGHTYEGWYQVELLNIPRPKRIEFCCSWPAEVHSERYAYGCHFKISENDELIYDEDIKNGLTQFNNLIVTRANGKYDYEISSRPHFVYQDLVD